MTAESHKHHGLRVLGFSLAALNLALWFSMPAIRAFIDNVTGRWSNPRNPTITTGVQELLVYFDPWLARKVFPAVYILGLAAMPFLALPGARQAGPTPGRTRAVVVGMLLIGLEAVWLALIAIGLFLRGPDWNLFWPGEAWSESKLVALNNVNLSDYFWLSLLDRPLPGSWLGRELPGLLLLGGYFLAGIGLAYLLIRWEGRATPFWRWLVLVLLLQVATLVPLKMACRWVFNLKYWIYDPEFVWNV